MNGMILIAGVSAAVGYVVKQWIVWSLLPAYNFLSPHWHWRYPYFESVMTIGSIIVFLQFPVYDVSLCSVLLLTWGLISLSFIDSEYFILPDVIVLPLWSMGLITNLFNIFTSPLSTLLGSIMGYLSFSIVSTLYFRYTSRIGLGQGDIKLFGLLGAWLGVMALPSVLWMASISGIIFFLIGFIMKRNQYDSPIPFGPFLALGGWLNLLFL